MFIITFGCLFVSVCVLAFNANNVLHFANQNGWNVNYYHHCPDYHSPMVNDSKLEGLLLFCFSQLFVLDQTTKKNIWLAGSSSRFFLYKAHNIHSHTVKKQMFLNENYSLQKFLFNIDNIQSVFCFAFVLLDILNTVLVSSVFL